MHHLRNRLFSCHSKSLFAASADKLLYWGEMYSESFSNKRVNWMPTFSVSVFTQLSSVFSASQHQDPVRSRLQLEMMRNNSCETHRVIPSLLLALCCVHTKCEGNLRGDITVSRCEDASRHEIRRNTRLRASSATLKPVWHDVARGQIALNFSLCRWCPRP